MRSGDEVIIDIPDGLVVDLSKSPARSLSCNREDVTLYKDFGELRRGARVAMGTGTAEGLGARPRTQPAGTFWRGPQPRRSPWAQRRSAHPAQGG